MFKRSAILVVVLISLGLLGGCISDAPPGAAGDIYTAATISNEELIQLSRDIRAHGDKENTVAAGKSKYAARLARMTDKLKEEDGLNLNFKAYITPEINANATADGSIRVYSGLMDMMTDNELFFIIGHKIGHVKDGDSLDKIRMAYASSGTVKAAAASNTVAGDALTGAQLDDLLHTVLDAQFSQKQETDADAYGYALMKKYKIDTKAAVSALKKLNALSASGGVMASHSDSGDRAEAILAKIDADKKK